MRDRRHDDRREGRQRIRADHQLEGVERAGERCLERGRDRSGGAAADQQAQIVAPQAEGAPEAGRERGADLGVARLQPDRRADAVGQDGLGRHEQAVAERHASAIQGVGFDRVDGAAVPPLCDAEAGQPDCQPSHRQHADRPQRVQADGAGQPVAVVQPE
jgi:hypothetical protein